jgi:hypothetical protein
MSFMARFYHADSRLLNCPVASPRRSCVKILACGYLGVFAGFVFGVGLALLCGLYFEWADPDDPSAWASSILVGFISVPFLTVFGFPFGMLLGGIHDTRKKKKALAKRMAEDIS